MKIEKSTIQNLIAAMGVECTSLDFVDANTAKGDNFRRFELLIDHKNFDLVDNALRAVDGVVLGEAYGGEGGKTWASYTVKDTVSTWKPLVKLSQEKIEQMLRKAGIQVVSVEYDDSLEDIPYPIICVVTKYAKPNKRNYHVESHSLIRKLPGVEHYDTSYDDDFERIYSMYLVK